jgi:hypothetical protein
MHSFGSGWNPAVERWEAERDKWSKVMGDLRVHPETTILRYDDLPECYDYVARFFPIARNVLIATDIYKNENTYVFAKLGLRGVGGFYVRPVSAVVLCYSPNFPDEVTVVHELLHCVRSIVGTCTNSRVIEETFAYSYSIPYLVKEGFSEEWIARTYLWPFGEGYVRFQNPGATFDEIEELTLGWCQQIIAQGQKVNVDPAGEEDDEDVGRWGLI